MKNVILILLIGLITLSSYAQTKLLKADAYLDVRTGKLVNPANILIEDGLIKEINPKSIAKDIEVIDLDGQILLPGLMDMHVHLDMNFEDGYQFQMVTESASKRALRAVRNAEKTVMAGFTTIRNTGQTHPALELIDVALSEASNDEWVKAPRIIPCGHMIGITGGHADISMMGRICRKCDGSWP